MQAWNGEAWPDLPPPTLLQRASGAVRLVALVALTALAVALFVVGRWLRAWLGRWVTFHFAVARLWSRLGLWIVGLRPVVRGTPIDAGALVANHCSWLDILALRHVRLIYFVSKAEVESWPAIGFITRVCGTIYIERRRAEAKRQEIMLRSRIAHDQLLCFFPEGTSTDGLRVLPFKSSLFSAFFADGQGTEFAIQPVTLCYRPAPGSGLPESFYGWWGDMAFERSIWEVLMRSRGGTVEVVFHPPVRACDFPDRKSLAAHCEAAVAARLGHRLPAAGSAVPTSASCASVLVSGESEKKDEP